MVEGLKQDGSRDWAGLAIAALLSVIVSASVVSYFLGSQLATLAVTTSTLKTQFESQKDHWQRVYSGQINFNRASEARSARLDAENRAVNQRMERMERELQMMRGRARSNGTSAVASVPTS